jgi:hypothetical protein
MKIFKDEYLTEEVKNIEFGKVRAGNSSSQKYFLLNESDAYISNMKFTLSHPELEIVAKPIAMKPKETCVFEVKWNALVDIKRGLKSSIEIDYDEEYWA